MLKNSFCGWSHLVITVAIVMTSLAAGCRFGGNFTADPVGPAPASTVSFAGSANVVLVVSRGPSASIAAPGGIVSASTIPQVTFSLSLIDVTNTASPVTRISKTVSANSAGEASAAFNALALMPVIAEAAITGGRIGSFSAFHGVGDLRAGSNTVFLDGKGARSSVDVLAAVVTRLTASPTLLAKAPSPLVTGVASLVSGVDRTAVAVYDNAFASAANSITQGTSFSTEVGLAIGTPSGTQIARLLGVNAGPMPAGEPGNATVTVQYQQMGIETIRIHDYYGPLDMATMYATHSADPTASSSYDFTVSDQYYQQILTGGFTPYFRIGDSYNPGAGYPKPATRKPTNNANYIQAAIRVIAHYNDATRWGRSPITSVEIWNEPDFSQFWDGTQLEFINLFASAAVAIKAAYPTMKIGGPGFTMNGALGNTKAFVEAFLSEMSKRSVPLDFFSWHMYSNSPASFSAAAAVYRGLLDQYGFTATKLHCTEFHTDDYQATVPEAMALRTGGKGAAILTAAWIELQNSGHEQAYVFRGNDTNQTMPTYYGLCYADGTFKKTGLAYSLWKTVCDHSTRLGLTAAIGAVDNLGLIAGENGNGELVMLVANSGATAKKWSPMAATGADLLARYTLTLKTVSDAASSVQQTMVTTLPITSPAYSVQVLTLTLR